jgi:catechol 2,3-dioxygenase-like lactoylglutathione lyase family enzyme
MTRTLHQVYLMVTDIDRSVEFYRDGLGLEPTDETAGRVKFDTGACTLVLEEDFDDAVLDQFGLEPPGDDRGSGVITVVEVSDIDAAAAQLESFGAEILTGPRTVDWGRELLLVSDPDGYVIEVSQPTEE